MTFRTIMIAAAGACAGLAFALSCGGGPQSADAAGVCDCPAAEAPLAGRIERVVTQATVEANAEHRGIAADCKAGAVVLGGSCRMDGPVGTLVLRESGIDLQQTGDGWYCGFGNTAATSMGVTVTAICLNPAP